MTPAIFDSEPIADERIADEPIDDDPFIEHGERLTLADLFGRANEAGQDSAYAEWTKGIAAAQLLNLETPDSFIESAPLNEEEQRWVDSMCGLAREQRDALCNNRLEYLLHKAGEREQLQLLLSKIEADEEYTPPKLKLGVKEIITMETHEILRILAPQHGREGGDSVRNRLSAVETDITNTVAGIERDMEAGHFRDYYRAKLRYADPDPHRLANGIKVLEMPFFAKEAVTLCLSRMQGSRIDHTEALWARMLGRLGMRANHDLNQSSRRRRRPSRDMEDEEE